MPLICLIDDDIMVRDALALALGDAGYEVAAAPGAAAGLDIADRRGVNVIVTDMNMPGVGGAQLIVEARERWPSMPIVAISGNPFIDGRSIDELARELGANAALAKPFRARQLVELLNRLLARPTTESEID